MPSRLIEPGAPAGVTLANFPVLSAQSFEKGHRQHSHRCQEGGNDRRVPHHKSARGFYSGWSGRSSWKRIIWAKAEVIKWRQSRQLEGKGSQGRDQREQRSESRLSLQSWNSQT